eukprot:g18352.t1
MPQDIEPTTQSELQRFLADNAAGDKHALQPIGGRTALHVGYPPARETAPLSLAKLSRVVDYPARDMTVTVEAGIRIDELATVLKAEGQQLPIDVAQSNRATLGGVVATNTSGPRRFGYGTLRDYVIGISGVTAHGRDFHGGGRVVKNVAGYDMCKLLVGSLGTLAVISQLTLKLKPIPQVFSALWVSFPDLGAVDAALAALQLSETRPVILDVFTPQAARSIAAEARLELPIEQPVLVIGVEGATGEAAWQMETLKTEIAALPGNPSTNIETITDDTADRLRKAITEFAVESDDPLTFEASVPPSVTTDFLSQAEQAGVTAVAHAGNGIVIGHLPDDASTVERCADIIKPLRDVACAQGGSLVIVNCDDAWKSTLSVFGDDGSSTRLMRELKAALDPDGLLNPGRPCALLRTISQISSTALTAKIRKQRMPRKLTMPNESHDELLAELLDQMVEGIRTGDATGPESLIAAHPELEHELRELWVTAQIAEECASIDDVFPPADAAAEVVPGGDAHVEQVSPDGFDDYELQEEIGRGGMGVVYRARQKSLGRDVALKMILQSELASEIDLKRFRSEAEAAAKLDHPNAVPVYEVGEQNGQPFFSMRLIEGTTLARRIAEGPLPPRDAARLLVPISRAIAEAHRLGLLHRDLKPSNILIDREGRPFVTDFGLAKRFNAADASIAQPESTDSAHARTVTGAITRTNAIVGTPGYMSPEQAAGRHGDVGAAADVYGLGALLYAMLTGRAPFQAASAVDTILMVLEQEPLPPRYLNNKTDPDLEMIAMKCLQKPADLRYPSAAALADDLEAYLAGDPVAARSSRFSEVISRAFRETHHAAVLENWGLLWMWHSLVLLVLCVTTNLFQYSGIESRLPYVALWGIGLSCWASFFWNLRRRAGPTTFVERQIAHVWAGSIISSMLLFAIEALLGMNVLTLSPAIGVVSGTVFLTKAGILSGRFYIESVALFATALAMALIQQLDIPDFGLTLFGVVSAGCYLFPGWKYHRQRKNG